MLVPGWGLAAAGVGVGLVSSNTPCPGFDLLVPRAGFFELSDLVAIDAVPLGWLGGPGLSARLSTSFLIRRFSIG
jgi:hypothetical protein